MANVQITIRRENGVDLTASGVVEDSLVIDICSALAAMLFDASMTPSTAPVVDPAPSA